MHEDQITDEIQFETFKELDEVPLGPTTHASVHNPFVSHGE